MELQRDVDKYKETASQATKEKIRTQQSLDNLKDDKRKTVRQEQDNQRSLKRYAHEIISTTRPAMVCR